MFGNVYLSIFMYSTNSLTVTNYNGLKLILIEWRKGKIFFSLANLCKSSWDNPRVLIKRSATASGHDVKSRVSTYRAYEVIIN